MKITPRTAILAPRSPIITRRRAGASMALIAASVAAYVAASTSSSRARAADWPQFRGGPLSSAASVTDHARLPLEWDDADKQANVAFKTPLPGRGASGPIVVRGRVIVTCSSGSRQDRLHVVCIDADSGKVRWERQFWATGRTLSHPTCPVAAPTPASDGERIYAFFSSNDMACLDLDGNLLWFRGLTHDYPAAANDVGMASSPLVVGKTVVVQMENQGDSFAAGLDTQNGETRWRVERTRAANYSSPTALRVGASDSAASDAKYGDGDVVLLQSLDGLTAHDPMSGRKLWSYDEKCGDIPSVTAVNGVVYVPSGGLTALRHVAGGKPEVLWRENRLNPTACSPIVHGGRVYTMNRAILVCGDAKTGGVLWQLRMPGGMYWATPVLVGDHLYVVGYDGEVQVVRIAAAESDLKRDDKAPPKGEIVGRGKFGELIQGSPAVADGALYVRSDRHLWKVMSKK